MLIEYYKNKTTGKIGPAIQWTGNEQESKDISDMLNAFKRIAHNIDSEIEYTMSHGNIISNVYDTHCDDGRWAVSDIVELESEQWVFISNESDTFEVIDSEVFQDQFILVTV